MKKEIFLLFVGHCKNRNLLNKDLLYNVVKSLPKLIEMKPISNPLITEAKSNPGLEGYLPIDTSNITISTYTNDNKIVGCIHSCKKFNISLVIKHIKKKYNCFDIKFSVIEELQINDRL